MAARALGSIAVDLFLPSSQTSKSMARSYMGDRCRRVYYVHALGAAFRYDVVAAAIIEQLRKPYDHPMVAKSRIGY
jgi:hypothetical protein